MALSTGTRLGPYEILSPIGAGGMGEVYKAKDTRLDRTVAVKVIPEASAALPEVRQRFEREARAVSSLSHPNICSLFDVGRQDNIDYLVMEYLEGETLAERLKKGPLGVPQALRFAVDIAGALDAAHRHGVVHRDLKPANIVLTASGPKVLDFGLAKIQQERAGVVSGGSVLQTLTTPLTGQGTIVGTLQYMSPEQLEGKEADARTDIFSFGAVLYEMLTGRRAFEGGTHAALISSIMMTEPPQVSAVQPLASSSLDHVVRTCLAKDPNERWHTAHDLLVQLKWIASAGSQTGIAAPPPVRRKSREKLLAGIAAGFALIAATLAFVHFREASAPQPLTRFQIPIPPKTSSNALEIPAVSPDGTKIVFSAVAGGGKPSLWLRSLDGLAPQPLPGTEDAFRPFWSPDSRSIAFAVNRTLKRLDLNGTVRNLCEAPNYIVGGSWNREGTILFGLVGSAVQQVPAGGGEAKSVLPLDKAGEERFQTYPWFLPDGKHFLYRSVSFTAGKGGIRVGSLDGSSQPLLPDLSNAAFVQPGYVLFGRQANLMAQAFDPRKLALREEAFPVAQDVGRGSNSYAFGASESGVIVWQGGVSTDSRIARYSRDGKRLGAIGEVRPTWQFFLSPDGRYAAVEARDPKIGNDIYVLDLNSGIATRLTHDGKNNTDPIWAPDGRTVVFNSQHSGAPVMYRKVVGSPDDTELLRTDERQFPAQQLADGSLLMLNLNGKAFSRWSPRSQKTEILVKNEFDKDGPTVSDDGKWIAYNSLETGKWEVYVAAYPSFTQRHQVSNSGGVQPMWRKDGKELFYMTLEGQVMSVTLKGANSPDTSLPVELFRVPLRVGPTSNQYAVTADGRTFYFLEQPENTPTPLTVVLNWTSGLKQ